MYILQFNISSLAQSSQYDQEGVIDIIRQYADHLYGYLIIINNYY